MPSVIAALAPYGEQVPRIEFLKIGEPDINGGLKNVISQWVGGTVGGFGTRFLTASEEESVRERDRLGRRYAARTCRLYYEATQQHVRTDLSPRGLGNIIQNYFLVIEDIAQREQPPGGVSEADERAAIKHILKLRASLDADTSVAIQTRKIRATFRELALLELRHLKTRIVASASRLGVTDAVRDEALTINELRNTPLSHRGRSLPDDLGTTAVTAERTARAFLVAFIDSYH